MSTSNSPPEEVQDLSKEEYDAPDDSSYSMDHLSAVVRPVMITMALAALAVAQIRDESSDDAFSQGMNMYLVYGSGSSDANQGTGASLGQAVINAIVIVCVIAAATFILVACYYFRCLKLMTGYLLFASLNLLGYTGGFMVVTFLNRFNVRFDWFTLVFLMWNFAAGGVISIFWKKGIPRIVTQGYLVVSSVIMAWILTKIPEWTSWALLVALALYDICAVLTPCGPLRALVNLAQERQDPIPGLLYEATIGEVNQAQGQYDNFGGRRTDKRNTTVAPMHSGAGDDEDLESNTVPNAMHTSTPRDRQQRQSHLDDSAVTKVTALSSHPGSSAAIVGAASVISNPTYASSRQSQSHGHTGSHGAQATESGSKPGKFDANVPGRVSPTSGVPLLADITPPHTLSDASEEVLSPYAAPPVMSTVVESNPMLQVLSASEKGAQSVPASNSKFIDTPIHSPHHSQNASRSVTYAQDGSMFPTPLERIYLVPESFDPNTIKLGIGDFVFYSVLVAQAARFDASSLIACFVCVVLGLGGTLALLGVFKKALPALPISIFFGVLAYVLSRFAVSPMHKATVIDV